MGWFNTNLWPVPIRDYMRPPYYSQGPLMWASSIGSRGGVFRTVVPLCLVLSWV